MGAHTFSIMKLRVLVICLAILLTIAFILHYFFVSEWDEVELRIHNSFVQEAQKLSITKKVILLYNHMESNGSYPIADGYCLGEESRRRQEQLCPYSCVFTDDKSVANFADAIVFSGMNLRQQDFPTYRRRGQYWVLLSTHPLDQTLKDGYRTMFPQYEEKFNWTMGYNREADVWLPYGRILEKSEGEQEECEDCMVTNAELKRKKKLIAWITTSNCFSESPSGRNKFIKSLARYVPIDIFGNCGPNPCAVHSSDYYCEDVKECYYRIGQSYKFHLAIEDSLSDDYVTEKFFHALEVRMVPVVLGKANYADIAIAGSYIDAADFASTEELAKYLQYLDQNPNEYSKFFRWHRYAYVSRHSHWEMGWCLLCSFLWEHSERNYSVSALADSAAIEPSAVLYEHENLRI